MCACRDGAPDAARIPSGNCRLGREAGTAIVVPAFWMGRTEVTVEAYCRYLNEAGAVSSTNHPQLRRSATRWRPASGQGDCAVAWVSRQDAEGYCRWLEGELGVAVRLPTAAEWEYAARGGRNAVRYPWGWGDPQGRARIAGDGPGSVGAHPPSTWGLYDLAGNLAEWCVAEDDAAVACGGSWADQAPEAWAVYARIAPPPEYRDGDVGFRIVLDDPPAQNRSTRAPNHG